MIASSLEVSLITATTALVASILGPVTTLVVARRQFQANVISTNRQRWIEAFRERVSELLSLMTAAQLIKRRAPDDWRGGVGPAAGREAAEKVERAFLALSEIRLLTDAGDAAHRRLNAALASALEHLQHDELREAELQACIAEVIELGRAIIRSEWARVKRGA